MGEDGALAQHLGHVLLGQDETLGEVAHQGDEAVVAGKVGRPVPELSGKRVWIMGSFTGV